jgi:hypothetical protein
MGGGCNKVQVQVSSSNSRLKVEGSTVNKSDSPLEGGLRGMFFKFKPETRNLKLETKNNRQLQ